ncbi:deoxyribonuclease-1-like 1 isoform X2 [Denticeps clupeoides]|uniref:deoxyribonuclease-1-like 1 isoform X2 n=1 Tax=Denticeps clupeoides TaxID=299321 RepID=UPI0010A3DC6C|nr:deoxyribonuclease gamma-like isoform X2 [Denticeps clupeoides]
MNERIKIQCRIFRVAHLHCPAMPLAINTNPAALYGILVLVNVVYLHEAFRICAFNVKSFGDSKSSDESVMSTLIRIVSRCDVCLLQEVRDTKRRAIPSLLDALNRFDRRHQYDYVASERLGRKQAYQEQYVFVYRTDSVSVRDRFQYPDTTPGDSDAFAREPFVVWLRAPSTVAKEFVLIPQHTSPSNATKEIDALYDVFVEIKRRWRIENVMLLGDFNADCGFVAKKNWKNVRLCADTSFLWLIGDAEDTTVKESTHCAYDRIVVHGESFKRAIVSDSARAFNFAKEFLLSEEQALLVSDHYPVEVELKTAGAAGATVPHLLLITVTLLISQLDVIPTVC